MIELLNGATISSGTFAEGDAAGVKVHGGNIILEGTEDHYTTISSNTSGSGGANLVEVTASGVLELYRGAIISSSTFSSGNAGHVKVCANEIKIRGSENRFTGITGQAFSVSSGDAGSVEVIADSLNLQYGAEISTSTYSWGNAGSVKVHADIIRINGSGIKNRVTGISSKATSGSFGNAGPLDVTVGGLLEMINGAEISSSTFSYGNGGKITVQAGELRLYNDLSETATGISSQSASDFQGGDAGSVSVKVDGLL